MIRGFVAVFGFRARSEIAAMLKTACKFTELLKNENKRTFGIDLIVTNVFRLRSHSAMREGGSGANSPRQYDCRSVCDRWRHQWLRDRARCGGPWAERRAGRNE